MSAQCSSLGRARCAWGAAPGASYSKRHGSRRGRPSWGGAHVRALSGGDAGDGGAAPSVPDTLPAMDANTDWRAFRAALVSASNSSSGAPETSNQAPEHWAHVLPGPEPGCLLLAHPLMFTTSQTYFNKAVILVFSHDANGSAGIILNLTLGAGASSGGTLPFLPSEMDRCQVQLGGDVGQGCAHLLSGVAGLEESVEVVPGVYLGGFRSARRGLSEGSYRPEQFRVFVRHAGWGPGQLEAECERGVWYPAAASPATILAGPTAHSDREQKWYQVMRLMGGQYGALADAAEGSYRADIMGAALQGEPEGPARPEEADEEGKEGRRQGSGGPEGRGRRGDPPPEDCKDGGCI